MSLVVCKFCYSLVIGKLNWAQSVKFILLSFSSFLTFCRDLGVHIDGFISNVAHSFVVGASKVKAIVEMYVCVQSVFLLQLLLFVFYLGQPHHRPES